MSVVTGSTLKTNMASALTALDTLITTPNTTNYNSFVASLTTVETNARDSRVNITNAQSQQGFAEGVRVQARAARREAEHIARADVGSAKQWRRLKKTLVGQPGALWLEHQNARGGNPGAVVT